MDANNLYGYAINKKLPLTGYKWVDTAILSDDFIKNYNGNGDKRYLSEVDVVYPQELHSVHRDLPFLTEKRSKRRKEYECKVSNEVKNYNGNGDKGYLSEVDVVYPQELHSVHRDLPFLTEKRSKRRKEYECKVSNEVKKAHRKVYKTFDITHEP